MPSGKSGDRPAVTHEGAVEALRLARDENEQISGSVVAKNMVRAALAYFETGPDAIEELNRPMKANSAHAANASMGRGDVTPS